jgi:hypothetical protein
VPGPAFLGRKTLFKKSARRRTFIAEVFATEAFRIPGRGLFGSGEHDARDRRLQLLVSK